MAVQRFAGDRFSWLEADSKPTNVLDGARGIELDSGKSWYYYDGEWKEVFTGSGGGGGVTAINNIGSTSSNQTINFNTHRLAKATLTGNIEITLTDGSSSADTAQGTIVLTQDGTGEREVTDWNGNVLFPGGVEPILSASSGAIDTLHFEWDGTNWLFVNITTDQS
jgi:hypothetical protein